MDEDIASTLSDALTWAATTTASALDGMSTDLGDHPIVGAPLGDEIGPDDNEGSYFLNTLLGLIIVLIASVLNALGLNLTKLDHLRQQSIPRHQRKRDYLRLLWLAGMGMYIASQVCTYLLGTAELPRLTWLVGSPLALRYLRPDWVAPLGSSSLIFNFIFARWLVGTPVTATDIRGTAVIVLGVILIMIFSSINHGLQQSISLERLDGLWQRGAWLSYFFLIVALTFLTFLISHFFERLIASRASYSPLGSPSIDLAPTRPRPPHPVIGFFKRIWGSWKRIESTVLSRMEVTFSKTDDPRIVWLEGMGWAVAGGSLAGLCLVFTKAIVKIFGNPGHPLLHPSATITLVMVIATAVCQIICLNKALVCADTVVVVPLFYAGYTVLGFINSLIFYDEAGQYAKWILVMVFVSIGVLITGVVLLSLKSSAKSATDPYTVSAQPSSAMRLNPRSRVVSKQSNADEDDADHGEGSNGPPKRDEVMWEVGSVSDDEDEHDAGSKGEDGQKKGLGEGSGRGTGERRGLLDDDEVDKGDDAADGQERAKSTDRSHGSDDDDEGFGEYEAVRRRSSEERARDR